ncbi:UPF0598 protein C8orf82 homolog [Alosa sapidissima]|uniref:UPF0598 protein C8orf82 homolog n=1 Tax=Alosa sapidissima TaxID=34773 RepID=UPI001C0820D7|nr:UPF0598 protein C8orf82 homolog [Alosa sapidissima]XP_041937760.1 UPF0598 protein C8orf82 homolog [Alosa sapidissima]XP_041937761.1 UPF0598 protein C8orf82 homolog [Alosa sapidissima]XP_041937762.1 UPF0598 protein C8orf82 homolog [Alosa sapidissima]XP_041937763.1 UPF0598 protein C8orf82 homolog [Alosa sapidissima]
MSSRLALHFGCRRLNLLHGWLQRQQMLSMCNVSDAQGAYIQGQSPEPRVREYFYYLDHQGQLFLDDTKVKNFITCFKDQHFLVFFFSRLRVNHSGRYDQLFPYVSPCGRERNFLRCDDQPVVFTHLLPSPSSSPGPAPLLMSYCGGGAKLAVEFRPEALYMRPASGRLYHPAPERTGGVGLVRSALAYELSASFLYRGDTPTHFLWEGHKYELTNELAEHLRSDEAGEEGGN